MAHSNIVKVVYLLNKIASFLILCWDFFSGLKVELLSGRGVQGNITDSYVFAVQNIYALQE